MSCCKSYLFYIANVIFFSGKCTQTILFIKNIIPLFMLSSQWCPFCCSWLSAFSHGERGTPRFHNQPNVQNVVFRFPNINIFCNFGFHGKQNNVVNIKIWCNYQQLVQKILQGLNISIKVKTESNIMEESECKWAHVNHVLWAQRMQPCTGENDVLHIYLFKYRGHTLLFTLFHHEMYSSIDLNNLS